MSELAMLSGDDARDEVLHWRTEADSYEQIDSFTDGGCMLTLVRATLDTKTVYLFTDDRGDFTVTRYPESMASLARSSFQALAGR